MQERGLLDEASCGHSGMQMLGLKVVDRKSFCLLGESEARMALSVVQFGGVRCWQLVNLSLTVHIFPCTAESDGRP